MSIYEGRYNNTKANYANLKIMLGKGGDKTKINQIQKGKNTNWPDKVTPTKTSKQERIIGAYDWFQKAFGFKECTGEFGQQNYKCEYNKIRDKLISEIEPKITQSDISKIKINGIKMGSFKLFTKSELFIMLADILKSSRANKTNETNNTVTVTNVVHDITKLHKELSSKESNATIQVSSKLNCLEMLRPTTLPHAGITIYMEYKTQCSLCSIATPAGLAYRNYLHKNKETLPPPYHVKNPEQINLLAKFLNPIKINRRSIIMRVENGYLFLIALHILKQ